MMDKDLMKQRDETGRLTFQNKQVEHLEPDTAYVAKIKVEFRWKSNSFTQFIKGADQQNLL